jgi:ParB family chromosome partitioning protein
LRDGSESKLMQIQNISLAKIKGPAFAIRTETRDGDPDLLASIKTHGMKQPILVRPAKAGYQIVAGVRRYQACKKLRFKTIPAIVEKLDDKTTFEIMLTENIQRRQLSALEEAKAFKLYLADKGWGSLSELGHKINKSLSYITDRIGLLDWTKELPEKLQDEIFGARKVSASHLQEIVRGKIEKPEKVREVIRAIEKENLTTDQTREVVQLVREREVPVERAVDAVKVAERARVAAEEVAGQLKEAVVKTSRDIKEVESSERRRLLENYMFLGSVIESLQNGKIYCVAHKSETPSLKWSCGTLIEETHDALKRKLGLR